MNAQDGRDGSDRSPYQRLRDWAAQAPNGTIALNLILAGAVLIVIAIVIALVAL